MEPLKYKYLNFELKRINKSLSSTDAVFGPVCGH